MRKKLKISMTYCNNYDACIMNEWLSPYTDDTQLISETSSEGVRQQNNGWPSHPTTFRYRIRPINSKAAIFLLVMNFLLFLTFPAQIKNIYLAFLGGNKYVGSLFTILLVTTYAVVTFIQLLYILLSCISDTCCGRFMAIKCGLAATCFGMLTYMITTIIMIIVIVVPTLLPGVILIIAGIVTLVAMLVTTVGILMFYVNVLQVTVQHLQKGSSEEVSAYIHWLVWTEALGLAIYSMLVNVASSCGEGTTGTVLIVMLCLQLVVFLVSGISWCCFSKKIQSYFPNIPTQSPYTVVYLVVKYAFTRRRPRTWESSAEQEMSMTSFIPGNEAPVQASSRLDYSKDIYGGPFTNQQVEDVKSCGRIFMVVLSLSAIFITNIPTSMVASVFASHIQPDNSESCSAQSIIVNSFSSLLPVILIPLYELVIYPLIGRYIPKSPKKIGLGMILLTVSLIFYFITDTVGHSKYPVACMFDDISTGIGINKNLLLLPNILNVLAYLLIQIGGLEFICSHSPNSMKGLLIAVFLGIRGLFWIIGLVLVVPFWVSSEDHFKSVSCGFGYYLLNIIITFIVIVISCVVAWRYAKRQRRVKREFGINSENPTTTPAAVSGTTV